MRVGCINDKPNYSEVSQHNLLQKIGCEEFIYLSSTDPQLSFHAFLKKLNNVEDGSVIFTCKLNLVCNSIQEFFEISKIACRKKLEFISLNYMDGVSIQDNNRQMICNLIKLYISLQKVFGVDEVTTL